MYWREVDESATNNSNVGDYHSEISPQIMFLTNDKSGGPLRYQLLRQDYTSLCVLASIHSVGTNRRLDYSTTTGSYVANAK